MSFAQPLPATVPALALEALTHAYAAVPVLREFSLTLEPGEIACLLGPSGCGKTTVLRLAAGLEPVQHGRILINGKTVAVPGAGLPPERRRVGFVFQDFALFPHLDLVANIAFGINGDRAAAEAWLRRIGLPDRARDHPFNLSGGEQQRVALARALAPRPSVMLMDEPFSSLDAGLRREVRRQTLALLRETGITALLVTHDPDEAMAMADRIAVMRAGRLVQVGAPEEVYRRPVDRFVARFMGEVNFLPAIAQSGRAETPFGASRAERFADGTRVVVMVRPEAVRADPSGVPATVIEAQRVGGLADVRARLGDGTEIDWHWVGGRLPTAGEAVRLAADPAEFAVLAAGSAAR